MLNVRMAQAEDIDIISLLLANSWKVAYRGIVDDGYLDSLKNNHWVDFLAAGLKNNAVFSMLLQDNQEIVGASVLGNSEKEDEIHLISLYLLPEKIGRGLGRFFYGKIETEMRKRGFTKCIIDVLKNNNRAIKFYEGHGFVDTSAEIIATLGEQSYICRVFEKIL